MNGKPLEGIGVLVTRPADQAGGLCALLEAEGANVVRFPVIEMRAPRDEAALRALLARLDEFDMAVFISTNAVNRGLPPVLAQGGLPAHLKVAAVGRRTAEELEKFGRPADILPERQFNSEALLALPEMQDVAGSRVIIFRGEGGRELLGDTLTARGAEVQYAEVYRRAKPEVDAHALLGHWERGEIDIIIVTSNEGLENLVEMAGAAWRRWLFGTPLLVMSERTAQLAQWLGFTRAAVVAAQASDAGLVSALQAWCAGRSGDNAEGRK